MLVEIRNIVLVGTAHVSEKSVAEVREAIATHDPDVVAIELDENRFQALTQKKRFEDTPITDIVRGGKAFFILAQTMLASFQRRMGAKQGVEPGAEMMAAIEEARARNKEIVLADRDIGVTLKRSWAMMGFREKMRLSWEFTKSLTGAEDEEEIEIEDMLQEDVLTVMMEELAETAPSVSKVLVKERDVYLAKKIHDAAKDGRKVLAVVGAGHMKGIQAYLADPSQLPDDVKPLEVIPKKFPIGLVISSVIGLAIAGFFGYQIYHGFLTGDWTAFKQNLLAYVLATGGCTAVGALLGGGSIWAALAGFVAAPLKPLHFFVGSGVFPGLVQAKVKKPTVKDFQEVAKIEKVTDLWRNRVTNILLTASFAQLGANVGLYLIYLPYFVTRAV